MNQDLLKVNEQYTRLYNFQQCRKFAFFLSIISPLLVVMSYPHLSLTILLPILLIEQIVPPILFPKNFYHHRLQLSAILPYQNVVNKQASYIAATFLPNLLFYQQVSIHLRQQSAMFDE